MLHTKNNTYIYAREGTYYFSRRVPEDLKCHYKLKRIVFSLRTKSLKTAQAQAASLATKLDADWQTLRLHSSSNALSRFMNDWTPIETFPSSGPKLSEARDLYVSAKGEARSVTFKQTTERSVGYMINVLGDRPIDCYTRADVNKLRDVLFERGLQNSSIRRTLNVVRALVNFTSRELGLPENKNFSGIYLRENETNPGSKRLPIPAETIKQIQTQCRELDDEARWLIALISDTGMRLSEAVGLIKSDVQMETEIPHIVLKQHPWRRLKTRGSERTIPLVGSALWAIKRATTEANGKYLFPKYCSNEGCKANSASAALNKWLSPRVPKMCVVHSFRHSMRDRLRAVECPPAIADRIGGWAIGGVGEDYGVGYPISVLHKWLVRIEGR